MGAEGAQGLAGDTSMKQVKLGDAAKFIRGITFKPDDKVKPFSDGSIVCFRTSNVQSILNEQDLIAVPSKFVKRREQFAQAGDILVSTANSWELVGKCSWVPDLKYRATIGGFISALRADPETVLPRYLYHWFNSPEIQLKARNCGRQTTNISNMDIKRCQEITTPLPPLEQQKRFAAILDKADELRAKRRRAIEKLDKLLKSVFLEMFGDPATNPKGWDTVSLADLIAVGPQNGLYRPASDYGNGTPIVRIDSFYKGKITGLKKLKRVRVEPSVREKYGVAENDILINRVNSREYLGKSALVPELSEPIIFESNMMRFSVNASRVHPQFIVSLLQHDYMRNQILGRSKDAVNQSSINQSDVKSFEVRLPPLALQVKYVSALDYIEDSKIKGVSASSISQSLFDSLQARAFSGDLTPDTLDEVEAVAAGS